MIWLLLACQRTKDLTTQYQEDPQQVIAYLQQLDNPIERLQNIESLTQSLPGQTTELCDLLSSQERDYCIEQNRRPHLWMPTKEKGDIVDVQASEEQTTCTTQSCIQKLALSAARAGNIQEVKKACAQSQSSKWIQECIFMAAEESVALKGSQNYAVALDLCLQAGHFQENCQFHLIQQMAKQAPDADSQSDWKEIWRAHHAIKSAWSWRNVDFQQLLMSRLWSEAIGLSFAGADQITGNLMHVVPTEYHCHIHSAAVWRAFQLEEVSSRNLEQWSAFIGEMLRVESQKSESLDQQRKFRAASDLWGVGNVEDGVVYLVTSHRWLGQTSQEDIQIAVLEAVARHPPVQMDILEEGLLSHFPLVSKTAKRLLEQIERE